MSLQILFRDELNGFYRSSVMLALWIGLPALSVILYLATPNLGAFPITTFISILAGSIGGTLAAAMLAVSIVSERERHVYDLFVIRPVKRRNLLLAKFLAVYLCVTVAALLALGVGIAADDFFTGHAGAIDYGSLQSSTIILLSMLAISSSAGILIGIVSPSALVAVILVLYGGNQLSTVVILPVLLKVTNMWFPLLPGAGISAGLLAAAVLIFNQRQL